MSFVQKNNESPWTWGVGIYGIGGFSGNYAASSLANPLTANPILTPQSPAGIGVGRVYTHAEIYQVAPTIALDVTEKLSVGFAPNLDLGFIQADPLIFAAPNFPLGAAAPNYGPGTGTRNAFGGGFQIGVYYVTDSNWRLGFSYKSIQWFEPLRYNSNNQFGQPVLDKVNFDLPQVISVGTAYTGFERWLYALDVRYTDYAHATGFGQSGFNANGSIAGLGWRSIVTVATGLQYELTERITVRGGYTFAQNPVPSSQMEFNLGSALIIQNFLSVGGSFQIRENVAANIAYTHGFQNSLTGPFVTPTGSIPATSITSLISADQLSAGLAVKF
jgi:long-chain fatty acid transport protein